MQTVQFYQEQFSAHLAHFYKGEEPENLYLPIKYILNLGGKRLRPVLTLLSAEICGANVETALNAALCIEVFHNFSLIHDDIMDAAPLRRGKETVHEKWDVNTAILSGDAMLILAYKVLENYPPETFMALTKLLSKTALEVCEGQQYDIDFETRDNVAIPEYLKMIEFKTAVLLGAAMQMGAIVANASEQVQKNMFELGRNIGVAFQLQDDYLDVFGNPETFGKQVGGDIIENKKTYLYLKAMELLSKEDQQQLAHLFEISPSNTQEKIEAVKEIYTTSGAAKATKDSIKKFTQEAFQVINTLQIGADKKEQLKQFANQLMNRDV